MPLHPLVVHAVVVFVPLAALGAIVISVSTWARRRYGWLTTAFALIAAVTSAVAYRAGQELYDSFSRPTPAMRTHMEIAFAFPAWSWLLFAGSLIVTVSQFLIDRGSTARWLRIATWVGIAIAVVTAIGATVQVVRVGHAGSVAVWGG